MATWQSQDIPVPEHLDTVQKAIFSELLLTTLNSDKPIFYGIEAGAGTGKTTVVTAAASTITQLMPNAEVRLITFTRAATGVMRSRVLNAGAINASGTPPRNIPATTLHADATEMLIKLNSVTGGVGYYHTKEMAEADSDESLLSMKLAVYSSIAYGSETDCFPGSLAPFMERYGHVMPIGKFLKEDYEEEAQKFIRFESLSEAGLTVFANGDVSDPDYIFPVATDAISRYVRHRIERAAMSGIGDGILFGPGKEKAWVFVDEVQDLSFIQLLYIRTLLLAGHHVILIGDPRQTLYEFRNAIGSMAFDDEFLAAFLKGTSANYVRSCKALVTNYRSRSQIIYVAEGVSKAIKDVASERAESASNLRGPIFCNAERGKPDETRENIEDKQAPAVTFFEAGPYIQNDCDDEFPEPDIPASATKRASDLLKERQLELQSGKPKHKKKKKSDKPKSGYKKGYASMLGGPDGALTINHIVEMAKRSVKGETAAILWRSAPNSKDIALLQKILRSRLGPDVKIEFPRLSGNKDVPLAAFPYLTEGQTVEEGVPPSSILLAGVMFFLFTWSQDSADLRKAQNVAALNTMPTGNSCEEILSNLRGSFRDLIRSIEIDLLPFLEGLIRHSDQIFPQEEGLTLSRLEPLGKVIAEFTLEVLARYSMIASQKLKSGSMIPCRFRMMTTTRNPIKRTESVALPSLSKFYFQAFWQAIVSTPLKISKEGIATFRSLGMEPEWIPENGTLSRMMEETAHWRSKQKYLGQSQLTDEDMETCLQARASIHQQFAKLYHSKTKTFTSSIVKKIKEKLKDDMSRDPALILEELMNDGTYKNARQEAGIGYKMTKRGMTGFFSDLIKHKNELSTRSLRPQGGNHDDGVVRIVLSTFHASKGLEWEHVTILFPDPNGDSKTRIRAVRDLIYVAMTRAARTLAVVITKPKDTKPTPTDTSVKVVRQVVYEYAVEHGLFRQNVEWDLKVTKVVKTEPKKALVFDETHHSELEKALRCSRHHFIQEYRNLPSMSPLPEQSYAFFFHSTMSAVVAAMAGTRLQLEGDGAPPLARLIERVVGLRTKMGNGGMKVTEIEGHIAETLCADGLDDAAALMEGLVPIHFSATNGRYGTLLDYYAKSFLLQMAGIITSSSLFDSILTARKHGGHSIHIESPLRGLPSSEHEGEKAWLPMVGIPDVRISGPIVNMIYDYKTVVATPEDDEAEDTHIRETAKSTVSQMTLYQWLAMNETKGEAPQAEVIYVADITVFSWQKVPDKTPNVPHFKGLPGTKIVTGLSHAFSIKLMSLNKSLFKKIVNDTLDLRVKTMAYGRNTPLETFEPEPLVGESRTRVSPEQCADCQSRWHCEKPVTAVPAKVRPSAPPRPATQVIRRKGVQNLPSDGVRID